MWANQSPLPPSLMIQPTRHMGGRAWQIFGSIVIAWSSLLGAVALCLGAWPMLPFCGLEILAVAWAWRTTWRRSCYREILTIEEGAVVAQRWLGKHAPSEMMRLPKAWAHVRVEWTSQDGRAGHAEPQVMLQAVGKRFEMGCCLAGDHRLALARQVEGWLDQVRHEEIENG